MTDRMIEQLQDYAKLQDALILIHQALETREPKDHLLTFNDSWNDEMVSDILEMIAKR
ncbi:hypothetical protein [Bacteroides pyogenes]|uniref:hypothetical protein n=1 Tax=Bacteroides pyogenes TaxID=310300 RepID=UPI002FD8BCC6